MIPPQVMAALHARCFTVPRPWGQAEFSSLLSGGGVFALGDGQGFILGRAIAGEAEVLTLAVAPEARRKGRARGLLQGFLTEAATRHAETAFLEVAANNIAAIALYKASDFAVAGRRKGYFTPPLGPNLDALVMSRMITPN
ncbi:GNAT family N-acetyltransferase [Pseudorhodobacter sp.]|uniref:GNAT family N-acetyltransferase n=1 Tax=Pseudorhodobacter sp. TaxID=1934400 RepID=UPI002647696F|nr:GNAT family N-acetyltransferase [Pseudorhodobacter sp.]MDN5787727.1 GNAT family N-acetyltransferase [Pseudorhodobacter sp.]